MSAFEKRRQLNDSRSKDGPDAQDDPVRSPKGSIYSGPSKRVAMSDGEFAPVRGIPRGTINNGRLPRR